MVCLSTACTATTPWSGLVLGAIWLWQRKPWGYVLGAVMMIKATTYALALIAMSVFSDQAGIPGAWEMAPLWAFLGAGCLVSCGALLGNMRCGEK